jgi:hemerythrin-like domain-containing protein
VRDMDIFTVLKEDHREAKDLFQKILKESEIDVRKLEKLCLMLTTHMELEEKLFYPRLEKNRETASLMKEAYTEHSEAKKLIRELEKEKFKDPELKNKTKTLKTAIEHHVDEEESEVFPKAKKVLTKEETVSIAKEFTEMKEKRLAKSK